MRPVYCCSFCGRDTTARSKICRRCLGEPDEHKAKSESDEFAQDVVNMDDEDRCERCDGSEDDE